MEAERSRPSLNPEQIEQLSKTFEKWAQHDPNPDKPVLGNFSGTYTSRQIADSERENPALWQLICNMVATYLQSENETFEEILATFWSDSE